MPRGDSQTEGVQPEELLILLKADTDGPAWTDAQSMEAFSCRTKTAENIRKRFVEEGFEQTLEGKRPSAPPGNKLVDGKVEAQIIAMRMGSPPPGHAQWTLRLMANRLVELEIVPSISHEMKDVEQWRG